MKRLSLTFSLIVAVLASAQPAHAGRAARRAGRTTAIVAGATAGAAVVAAAPRRTTVVAAAPVAVASQTPVVELPDLTLTGVVVEDDALCMTVKNVGQTASPTSKVQVGLADAHGGVFLGGQTLRVLPLAVAQSVRVRLRGIAAAAGAEAHVRVDPLNELAEFNEQNNDFAALIAVAAESAPPVLEDAAVWSKLQVHAAAGANIAAGAGANLAGGVNP